MLYSCNNNISSWMLKNAPCPQPLFNIYVKQHRNKILLVLNPADCQVLWKPYSVSNAWSPPLIPNYSMEGNRCSLQVDGPKDTVRVVSYGVLK